jgi:hypothetical protein
MSKLKFASLTAGLLARKGEAEPSATPYAEQLLTRVGAPAVDLRPMIQNVPQRPATPFAAPIFGRRVSHDGTHPHHEPVDLPPAPIPLHSPSLLPHVDDDHHDVHPEALLDLHHDVHHEVHHEAPAESRCGTCPGPSAEDANKTYHVNLRMKRMRFIRLKLTSALLRKPVQEIVSEALDAWFETVPHEVLGDCACLNSRGE